MVLYCLVRVVRRAVSICMHAAQETYCKRHMKLALTDKLTVSSPKTGKCSADRQSKQCVTIAMQVWDLQPNPVGHLNVLYFNSKLALREVLSFDPLD